MAGRRDDGAHLAEGFEAIVVAVPNMGGERIDEYSLSRRGSAAEGATRIRVPVDTLKPNRQNFAPGATPTHTGILGSSMGGLISLYAFFTRPDVFGFAAR